MSNFSDMTGMRFGKWLVLAYIGNSMWSCLWSIDDAMAVWTPRMIRSIAERSDAK